MKKTALVLIASFAYAVLFAQDVRINDSIIFIKEKPVAVYATWLSNTPPRYNMEVYSFTDYVLIKAEILKFSSPVQELKPFYFYEITFPPTADTLSIYLEDEAFSLVLAKLINEYNLISNDQINKKGVDRFIKYYPGGPALLAKIKGVEDYLEETRDFNDQIVRDRSKPVVIVKNRIIMQDNVEIGRLTNADANAPVINPGNQIRYVPTYAEVAETTANNYSILLPNQRPARHFSPFFAPLRKGAVGYSLYKISLPKKMAQGSVDDILLQRICFLIEDYAL